MALGRALFQEGLTCPTVTGGPTVSHPSVLKLVGHVCISVVSPFAELGEGWGKTRGVMVIREPPDGPHFFGDRLREESSPAIFPVKW